MRREAIHSLLACTATLALAGCGGAGGVVASIPTPPVTTPTQTPTPPPSPAAPPIAPAHLGLVSASPFAALGSGDTFTTDSQGQHVTPLSGPSLQNVELSYNAASNTYQISLPNFLPGTLANTSYGGTSGQPATSSFSQVTAGSSNELQSVNVTMPVPGFSPYTYTSHGEWTGTISSTGDHVVRGEGIFVYGIPTAMGDMPTTGSASYTAAIYASRGMDSYPEVGGTVNLTFNFGNGTLSGFMHPQITDDWDGIFVDFGRYDFTNAVYSAGSTTFSGQFIVPGLPNASSSFNGNFTGPNAAELMAHFQAPFLVDGSQGTIAGIWIGQKN